MIDAAKLREAIKIARYRIECVTKGDGGHHCCPDIVNLKRLADAAESTLPQTKMVEVWRVEYWDNALCAPACSAHVSEEAAKSHAIRYDMAAHKLCLRITGPHQQEVPV